MACALPYHATVEFVRLVQIMPLDKTIWAFLRPMQKSGAPLPRPVLVQRCLNDMVRALILEPFEPNAISYSRVREVSRLPATCSLYSYSDGLALKN